MQTRVRQRGLTLIEAGITLAIVAILAAMAAPGLQSLIANRRVVGAAAQLATDIQFVRSAAVLRNQPLRLSVRPLDDATCYVIHSGAAAQCTCRPSAPAECSGGAEQIKTVAWPAATGVALQGTAASLLFDPQLGTVSPTATLRVVGAHERAVHHVVNILGRVRSCTPEGVVPGFRAC